MDILFAMSPKHAAAPDGISRAPLEHSPLDASILTG